jgi:hypothetical protein
MRASRGKIVTMAARLAAFVVIVAAMVSAGCGGRASGCSAFACKISVQQVGGVRAGMTVPEVQRRWHISVDAPEVVLGSDSVAYAAICQGVTHGWARFWGPNGGPFELTELHFISGARTSTGIRIGSDHADVVASYGTRAFRPRAGAGGHSNDLMVLSRLAYREGDRMRRPAIVFGFRHGKVDQIVFGWRDSIRQPVGGSSWRYEIPALPTC